MYDVRYDGPSSLVLNKNKIKSSMNRTLLLQVNFFLLNLCNKHYTTEKQDQPCHIDWTEKQLFRMYR